MSMIRSIKEVKVGINFGSSVHHVGRMAIRDRQIYFEYDCQYALKTLPPCASKSLPPLELLIVL